MDQHLQIFITVAEKQSFSKAAAAHYMTQPAVSQYIRTLENSMGVRLLERSNKYVRLNKAGEIVYHHGKEILGLYTTMQHLVDDLMNQANGPLSIGASYTFGEYVLPRIIANMQETYPDIDPTVTIGNTEHIAELVESHQLDIGIVEGHFPQQKLITEEFAEDDMVIVVSPSHRLGKRSKPVGVEELQQEKWIVREHGSGTREATETVFEMLDIKPSRLMHYSSTQPIKESVAAGLGVSLLSQWAIQKEIRYGDLKIIPVRGLPFSRKFSIITQSPFQTKALETFIGLLHDNRIIETLS